MVVIIEDWWLMFRSLTHVDLYHVGILADDDAWVAADARVQAERELHTDIPDTWDGDEYAIGMIPFYPTEWLATVTLPVTNHGDDW